MVDCFKAFVIYREDSLDVSFPRHHKNVGRYVGMRGGTDIGAVIHGMIWML